MNTSMLGARTLQRSAIAITAVIFFVCAFGVTKLTLNSDTRVFFAEGNVNRQALDTLEARYAPGANIFIAFKAREGDVFTPERIAVIEAVTDAAWRMPHATRVDSITNAVHISSDPEGVIITPMTMADEISGQKTTPAELKSRVLSDSLLLNKLISPSGAATGILVRLDYPASESAASAP